MLFFFPGRSLIQLNSIEFCRTLVMKSTSLNLSESNVRLSQKWLRLTKKQCATYMYASIIQCTWKLHQQIAKRWGAAISVTLYTLLRVVVTAYILVLWIELDSKLCVSTAMVTSCYWLLTACSQDDMSTYVEYSAIKRNISFEFINTVLSRKIYRLCITDY